MKISELIARLQQEDQSKEVEFLVVTKKGLPVCMDVSSQADAIKKVIGLFKKG